MFIAETTNEAYGIAGQMKLFTPAIAIGKTMLLTAVEFTALFTAVEFILIFTGVEFDLFITGGGGAQL